MKCDLKQCQCYSSMLCNHEDFNVESGFHFVLFFRIHYMNPFCLWLLQYICLKSSSTEIQKDMQQQNAFKILWFLVAVAICSFCLVDEEVSGFLSMFIRQCTQKVLVVVNGLFTLIFNCYINTYSVFQLFLRISLFVEMYANNRLLLKALSCNRKIYFLLLYTLQIPKTFLRNKLNIFPTVHISKLYCIFNRLNGPLILITCLLFCFKTGPT